MHVDKYGNRFICPSIPFLGLAFRIPALLLFVEVVVTVRIPIIEQVVVLKESEKRKGKVWLWLLRILRDSMSLPGSCSIDFCSQSGNPKLVCGK